MNQARVNAESRKDRNVSFLAQATQAHTRSRQCAFMRARSDLLKLAANQKIPLFADNPPIKLALFLFFFRNRKQKNPENSPHFKFQTQLSPALEHTSYHKNTRRVTREHTTHRTKAHDAPHENTTHFQTD
jgi:hypothetical protein